MFLTDTTKTDVLHMLVRTHLLVLCSWIVTVSLNFIKINKMILVHASPQTKYCRLFLPSGSAIIIRRLAIISGAGQSLAS